MRNIEGLYTAIGSIISQHEDENKLAMKVDDIIEEVKGEVDVHSASLDWYIRFALRAAIEVGLYQRGYKSVVKGTGLFVNPNNCNNPAYLARLFNNAKMTEDQKRIAVDMIRKAIKQSGCEGQLRFDFESGTVIEDVTEEQLIAMLEQDATDDEMMVI